MTVTATTLIVYSPLMGLIIVVTVSPGNKKGDPVVETPTRNSKNNVILPVNVVILMVVAIRKELVENEPQIKIKFL